MSSLKQHIGYLIDLFYPRICLICGRALQSHEKHLCMYCIQNIPRTQFHSHSEDNIMEHLFRGKVQIEKAVAFFYFSHHGDYRHLIHQIKYRGEKECARYLGEIYARELGAEFFTDIDLLVPVPLHPKRLRKRGYNQSEWIAMGISDFTGKDIDRYLIHRCGTSETQTNKGIYKRWENTQNIFTLGNTSEAEGKHLLLIDDVVTTGATLLSCANTLSNIKNIKISLLTLAIAQ